MLWVETACQENGAAKLGPTCVIDKRIQIYEVYYHLSFAYFQSQVFLPVSWAIYHQEPIS